MSCRPHHTGDISTTKGNNLKTKFFICGQTCKKFGYSGAYGGGGGGGGPERGASIITLGLSWFTSILSAHINVHVK